MSKALLALTLAAGPVAGLGVPALAQGVLPGPQITLPPVPKPVPTQSSPAPVLPLPNPLPQVSKVPTLPTLPTVPGLPKLPGTSGPAAKPAAPPPGDSLGFLPFGHYVDDGLGRWLPPLPVITVPHYDLPAEQPYDDSGYNTYHGKPLDDHNRIVRAAEPAGVRRNAIQQAAHAVASHLLLDALALLVVTAAGAAVVSARKRGLL